MDASTFSKFLTQIAQLSRSQCAQVLELLQPLVNQGQVVDLIEKAVAGKLCCPRCQGNSLYRHGAKNGLQRFRCRSCGRTFNSLTGTPLARLRHKDKWLAYADCLLDSRTVARPRHASRSPKTPACAGATAFWRAPKRTGLDA